MNFAPFPLSALLAGFLLCGAAAAQIPVDPPPWWRVPDDVTVSLFWDFNAGPASPPNIAVVPTWYSPLITGPTFSPNVVGIPALAGHAGCVGLLGTGVPQAGFFNMKVDNDPHLNWVKLFWFQFDACDSSRQPARC